MSKKKLLITTAIDYTNDSVHIGHSYQKVLSDCIARFYRQKLGKSNVYFLTGTDEYGSTNQKAALARGITPKEHTDEISQLNKEQFKSLNISYDRFIRTTDEDHKKTAQEIYSKSFENGDIYKSNYEGLYCDSCESYKTMSELNEEGQCLLHPTKQIQKVQEENYFFRWSKYSEFLKELLSKEGFVLPEGKRKEMLAFVDAGLKDLPVSRPKYKVSWGIEVPNDSSQVIYVWFDALINYYTAGRGVGFWDEDTKIIHLLGKDNARWHALLWPAMLKSVGLRMPDVIYAHGFINLSGEKISKSRGNVIRPSELVEKFTTDAVRYYFLKFGPIVEDVNFTPESMLETYNSDLANGLGNTVARLAKLAQNSGLEFEPQKSNDDIWNGNWAKPLEEYRVDLVLQNIWKEISDLDKHINDNAPWKIEDKKVLENTLSFEINILRKISRMLEPFMPETSEKISKQFLGPKIQAEKSLFPRL